MKSIEEIEKMNSTDSSDFSNVSLFVWSPDLNKDRKKLLERVHKIGDRLFKFFKGRNKSDGDSPTLNPMSNYDLFDGKLPEKKFDGLTQPWGEKGNAPLKDYSFFNAPINRIVGEYEALPFRFSCEKIGQQAAVEELDAAVEKATEKTMRGLAEMFSEAGVDVSEEMVDPNIYVPEEGESPLTGTEKIEEAVYDMMRYIAYRYRLQKTFAQCLRDKCIVQEQYIEITEGKEDPIPTRHDPRSIAWIGDISDNNLESCDCVGVIEYQTVSKVVENYGVYLKEDGSYEDFIRSVEEMYKSSAAGYTPYNDGTLQEKAGHTLKADYFSRGSSVWESQIAVQRFYPKMIVFKKNRVTYKGKPLTPEQLKDLNDGVFEDYSELLYEPLPDDYESNKKETIRELPVTELYEAIRLGDCYLAKWSKVKNQVRKEESPTVPEFPIKGYIGDQKSLVSMGEALNEVYVSCFYLIRKLINNSGTRTLFYDLAQLPDGMTQEDVLYETKEVTVSFYNSQQIKGTANTESMKHLTTADLGLQDDVIRLTNIAMLIKQTYNNIIGQTNQMQGITQPRETNSQTGMGIDMGKVMMQPIFFEQSEFAHQVLQYTGEKGRILWSKDELRRYIIGKDGVKTIRLSKNISLYRYGFFLTDSYKDQQDKEFLLEIAKAAIPAGQGTLAEVIAIYNSDNPKSAEKVFKDGMSTLERIQAQQAQANSQAMAEKAKADQLKAGSPERVAQMNNQTKLQAQQMVIDFEREKLGENLDHKNDLTDQKAALDIQKQQMQAANDIDKTQAEMAIQEQFKQAQPTQQ